MAYTVQQLARLSGVSVRTLHFYDEIGLLMPAYCGENHYRYYGDKELLELQQILFFKELGFRLGDIHKILHNPTFDTLQALITHRQTLEKKIEQQRQLIDTIDKTVARLQRGAIMDNSELYCGFDQFKQKRYEDYLIKTGKADQATIDEAYKRVENWPKQKWDSILQEHDALKRNLASALLKNLEPSDPEVQCLIRGHYEWMKQFWVPDKETYKGILKKVTQNTTPIWPNFWQQL